jgi:hypothetical protein
MPRRPDHCARAVGVLIPWRMSAETPAYSPLYVKSWTALSIVLAVVFLATFIFGDTFLAIGHVVWSLLRWLASPFI